ncbi:MAG: flagellar hook-basal body complex protein FliE [Planctomycetota bacterium]|nr:flagellar hook-basal body complex protein FliE [Planctomycetota bacterium]
MANIGPIPSVRPPLAPTAARAGEGVSQAGAGGDANFGDMLKGALGQADGSQQEAVSAVQDLLAGKSEDLLSAVSAMAKADLSFKMLLGVRNKVIDAYKQTMNMQI